jgi:hypothetical protein
MDFAGCRDYTEREGFTVAPEEMRNRLVIDHQASYRHQTIAGAGEPGDLRCSHVLGLAWGIANLAMSVIRSE